ncbi:MAG: hypothetical protein HKN47_09325, partial [Pirellulaceae bacterium]|nr:hypothetical protein [Pirellulaceae bacterium]
MSVRSTEMPRRRFLATAGAASLAGPLVMTSSKAKEPSIIGRDEHTYEVIHQYPQLPDRFTWQTTHNVAVDKDQNLYV